MVEMTVGSRFWYKDKLCEVVETGTESDFVCDRCVFDGGSRKCEKSKCASIERHDGKGVYFREVKE